MTDWERLLEAAWERRKSAIDTWEAEETEAYRVFHGSAEGMAGVTIDRYGMILLIQSFIAPLAEDEIQSISAFYKTRLPTQYTVYNHRVSGAKQDFERWHTPPPEALAPYTCKELGITYQMQARHRGIDPLLFLDMRAGRRLMKQIAKGKSVLNLFAYTCTMGICAAHAGAHEVWNVDFSASNLAIGRQNAHLNGLKESHSLRFIQEDAIPVMRQLAGLPIKGKAAKRQHLKFPERAFSIVFLDPPRWARSAFGAVDLRRDYQSLFKPALLATAQGGLLIAVNHLADVPLDAWLDDLQRCAQKCERPLASLSVLPPEDDFPSFDGQHPLKIALCVPK